MRQAVFCLSIALLRSAAAPVRRGAPPGAPPPPPARAGGSSQRPDQHPGLSAPGRHVTSSLTTHFMSAQPLAPGPVRRARRMPSQRRAVIAAQDARLCRSLREALEALGFVTWNEVSDGLAALTQIRRTQPHLVVLAPPLTSLDGAQVMETLIRGEMAPVVLVLGEGDLPPEAGVREASACAQLVRPFTAGELAEAVELAERRFRRLCAIRVDLQQLRAERGGSRLLERAKSLLMRRHHPPSGGYPISETEAFWRILSFCLESDEPARAAVEALIASHRPMRERDELTPR